MTAGDERYALMLDEAQRALAQQQSAAESLRQRAGLLVSASSVAASVLGAVTVRSSHRSQASLGLSVAELIAFVLVVTMAAIILRPYTWRWGVDARQILADYIECEKPADVDEIRRSLAWFIADDVSTNLPQLNALWADLEIAIIALGAQVLFGALALIVR